MEFILLNKKRYYKGKRVIRLIKGFISKLNNEMNQKNKSSSKLSPVKLSKNRTHSKEEGILKSKRDHIVSANKSSKSPKSLTSKSNLTKSTNKPLK